MFYKNSYLKKIFTDAEFLYKEPLVISQISFANKEQQFHNILFAGDAAGLITPSFRDMTVENPWRCSRGFWERNKRQQD